MKNPWYLHTKTSSAYSEERLVLQIYVQPGAKKSEVVGLYGEPPRLKIKVAAPPVDGAANEQLIKFLSKLLDVSKSKLHLLRGETSRQKDVLIDADIQQVTQILQNIARQ